MLSGTGTTANTVIGNFIGTNAAGTAAVPNLINGLAFVAGAAGNTAGGFQTTERNLISGNQGVGVGFFGTPGTGGNSLISNLVGTDVTGTAALGNSGSGVYIQTSGNNIGSLTTGVGNTIAFNGSIGVRVDSGTGNAIVYNQIFSNAGLGIDLAPLGVTPNDAGDADVGANNLLNHPVLSSARVVGPDVLVHVALSPSPSGPIPDPLLREHGVRCIGKRRRRDVHSASRRSA